MTPLMLMSVGIAFFFGPHTYSAFRSRHPGHDVRARREAPYMIIYSLLSILGLGLIIWGYVRWGPAVRLYQGPDWTYLVSAIVMLPALILFIAGNVPPGRIRHWVGHPMVLGTLLWGSAHLLTGFSLKSALLFAPFAIWAALDFLMATRREAKPSVPLLKWDIIAIVVGAGLYVALILGGHAAAFGAHPMPL